MKNLNDEEIRELDVAYCRAALYTALAIGFHAPTDESASRLLSAESRSSLASAAAMLYPSREPDLISWIEAFPEGVEALASRHRDLFGHTARGAITFYETEYGNEALFQQPQELSDLMGFYHAFGLRLKQGQHERPDHVSCECEFLTFLALKEAYALEHNDQEMLAETRKAEKLFLRDHLARFFPAFAAKLIGEDPSGFYGNLAAFGLRFVMAECNRVGVSSGSESLGLRPADDQRVPMACGSAECAAMPGSRTPEEGDSV